MVVATNQLGNGSRYKVVLAWMERVRPAPGANFYNEVPIERARLHSRATLTGVLEVEWERVVNDVSTARVVVDASCCELLKSIEPLVWEIQIYRDGERVWEGPIINVSDWTDSSPATITASDVLWWLGKRQNRANMQYDNDDPARIAEDLIELIMNSDYSRPVDYPLILDYMYVQNVGDVIDYKRGVTFEWILDTFEDLTKYGLTYTTVGRSIILGPQADSSTPLEATLRTRDFDEPVEVIQDAEDVATFAWAVRRDEDDQETAVGRGVIGTRYGVVDGIVEVDDDATNARMIKAANNHLKGRRRPPVAVVPPSNARLKECAPISVSQLVAGKVRVALEVNGICWGMSGTDRSGGGVRVDMYIMGVSALWVPGGNDSVQVSFGSAGQATAIG